jgi:hypothetical protein
MSKIILTSEKVQEGHFLKNRELVLYVDGKRYDEYLSHNERVECLNIAIKEFDDELQTAAERFKDHPFGAYLWLYTPDFIRGEEITGLYRRMYFKAIIGYLHEKKGFQEIRMDTPITNDFMKYLRGLSSKISCNSSAKARNLIHNILQNAKHIFKSFSFNLNHLFKRPNEPFAGTLIDTSSRFNKSRYDDLEKVTEVFIKQVKYFSGDQIKVTGCPENQTVVFKRELTIGDFLAMFVKSIKISRFIRRNKKDIPPGIYHNHKGFYKLLLYWDLLLAQKSMGKYLDKSDIKTIVQVSTYTKPIYRSLVAAARQRNIPFIQVASRSLMRNRCSERLLRCDVDEYNTTAIPDWFIVKDNYSAKVFDPFPELKHRIMTGGRFKSQQIDVSYDEKPPAILLMFNHRKDLSYKLLKEIKKSGVHKLTKTIIFRCHPSFIFPDGVLMHTFSSNEVIDITGKDYSALSNYRTICISGPTTGALDAVKYGTIVLWVPYIWDDGILMDDIMKNTGAKANHSDDIHAQTADLMNNHKSYFLQLEKDSEFCSRFFSSKDLISDIINQIGQLLTVEERSNIL